MKIFIIGAGFTGTQLARALVLERNNVVLIDNDPERVRYASDQLDCTVLEADGNNLESLEARIPVPIAAVGRRQRDAY